MVRLFLRMVQKFGFQEAKKMAPRFGINANHIAKAEQQVAVQRGASGLQQGSFDKFYGYGQPRSAQTFAQRKAARMAAPYNERMRQNIANRATGRAEREAASRARLTPDQDEANLTAASQGLPVMDDRASNIVRTARNQQTRRQQADLDRNAHSNIDSIISQNNGQQILERLRGRIGPEQLKRLALLLGGGAAGYGVSQWE